MKITRIAAVGLITATIAVAGFAGCGSSSSSSSGSDTAAAADTAAAGTTGADTTGGAGTEAEFVAAANQVCTDSVAAVKAATDSGDATTLEGLQATMQSTADAAKSSLADLQAIEPPADLADAYQAFLDAQGAVVTAAEDIATKVAGETDLATAQQVIVGAADTEKAATAEVESAAKAVGLDACAG